MRRRGRRTASAARLVAVLTGALVWIGGCSTTSSEGVTVTVAIEPAPGDAGRTLVTAEGLEVTLLRAFVTVGSVEIFPCAGGDVAGSLLRLRVARAHVVGSPTLLGVPAVTSLLPGGGSRLQVGELRPPAGSYCGAKLRIFPADSDAVGLPADGSMVGSSLLVEGSVREPGGGARPLRLRSSLAEEVDVPRLRVSLSLEDKRRASLVITPASDRWLDGVDLFADDAGDRVLRNVRASLGARFE